MVEGRSCIGVWGEGDIESVLWGNVVGVEDDERGGVVGRILRGWGVEDGKVVDV